MKKLQTYTTLEELTKSILNWESVFSLPVWYENQYKKQLPLFFKEESKKIRISVEVPGYTKEQLDITHQGTSLIISGAPKTEGGDTFLSPFSYKVQLTNQYQFSEIAASVENGLLTIEVPKTKVAQTKKIKIN